MDTITTVSGTVVPVNLPGQPNQWIYDSFYISDIFSEERHCGRCSKVITYVHTVKHPSWGTAEVGMECVRMLADDALREAMDKFKGATSKISQHRFKSRIARIRSKIPKGILEILKISTKKGSVEAKAALDHLEDKLALRVFLSSQEVEILQKLEEKV